ncbi:unnamed protein product [Allacma fusca]|uniref:F-actin monooxygenase n=1 Tax=Allacma fusca TaxID=39272 RepID=A0A8J2L1A9_9HEXA|nr:unnamed protein product [Allacma fusca]
MDPRRTVSPESALASDIFDKFCSANTLKSILIHYRHLCSTVRIKPTHFPEFYPRLKAKLSSWRAQALWSKFEKRASHKLYNRGKSCYGSRVLIIGAGPCGLRTAIEAQLLGAKVVLIEKRDRFSRNNVLHLWPSVIADLKALGAKKFYGKFCAGSIDHISIRQLQCILLKVALLLGVEVLEGVGFEGLLEPTENEGWRAKVSPADHPVSLYNFDVLIGADGRRNTLEGFKRKALRAKLAIAITANFINKHTEAEARVKEISGVSYIFNQKFFQELNEATGIDLENIVYYKDETHYFVMTAKKQSLLNKGVLLEDHADTARLLSHENISSEALMTYALEAAIFSTDNQLPNLDFAVNHYGQPDVAMFDFTAMYAAENACRVVQRKGHKLLMSLVGDSLLEPFWPTGSGCARGFLSSFDACWMLKSWSSGVKSVLEVIAERESIYRLLGQTTPENLNKEHMSYSLDPSSRYPNLNTRAVMPFQVKSLYDSDEPIVAELVDGHCEQLVLDVEKVSKKRRRDSVIAVDSLLQWLREQIVGYGLEVSDVCDAFNRGDVLCAIINRFRPDLIEFPLPSEENVDPIDISACRNQIAFDILQEEFGLPLVMSGFDSVQCTSSDFLTIVAYLSQIYEIFRGEIPQMKYPRVENCEDLEEFEHQQISSHTHAKQHNSRPALVIKHVSGKSLNRRSRMSSSGREGRPDGDSESSRKHKKRRSEDRSRVSVEEREKRRQDIEKNRSERQRRRMQERVLQTERFIKSMRLLQLNDRTGEISVSDVDDNHFEDYTFHLYRKMASNFEDRCKFLEQKLFNSGREVKTSSSLLSDPDKQNVTGLAKNLEEKLKGTKHVDKKPKDLIRSIGKIEKSDWNVQLIEKKIAESKTHCPKKDRDDKVPKWSREAFDDKREAMKRKMEGSGPGDKSSDRQQLFEDTMKKLGSKLKEGNSLEVGQRGANKVSQMASKLVNKLEKPKEEQVAARPAIQRPVFEFPKRGGSENCHFCKERVYVVEKMTAEGKFFHRNCFRCEYCNTSLRLGNYVFDREGRYGERFYCTPHYGLIRVYGWKKYDQDAIPGLHEPKYSAEGPTLDSTSQQILSEMDERGTTPERVEFENSVDFASEEELLSEMDEEEWTDRNGFSNADNNTSDEASDLSDDDVTPEGVKVEQNSGFSEEPLYGEEPVRRSNKGAESSDSDTEVASGEESVDEEEEEESGDEDDEDELEEEEEEDEEEDDDDCEGSTTEIETDSEFAEDPPHSVPGKIPTIVVNEPEQLVTRMIESTPLSHTQSPSYKHASKHQSNNSGKGHHLTKKHEELADLLQNHMVEPVKRNIPERVLPRVNPVPKKWEPLPATPDHHLASKLSLELKHKYLHGAVYSTGFGNKKTVDTTAQNQFRSVLDMISEKQKLLQPAAKPSATMQAFLDGAEKLKMKPTLSPLSGNSPTVNIMGGFSNGSQSQSPTNASNPKWSSVGTESKEYANETASFIDTGKNEGIDLINMNRLNLEKNRGIEKVDEEKGDHEKEIMNLEEPVLPEVPDVIKNAGPKDSLFASLTQSDTPTMSQSETDTLSTIIGTNKTEGDIADVVSDRNIEGEETQDSPMFLNHNAIPESEVDEGDDDSETESAEHLSESDIDADIEENCQIQHDPPRVEIEDEFGVSLKIDDDYILNVIQAEHKECPYDTQPCTTHEDDISRSVMSSSDSKDSLNSGMFLETEMSDWTRDAEEDGLREKGQRKKKKNKVEKQQKFPSANNSDNFEKYSKLKSTFALDLANLDFADMDGISSPEEAYAPKKQGYCKLANEEGDSDNDLITAQFPQEEDKNFSTSSRESTPTVGSIQETENFSSQENHEEQKAGTVVEAVNPMLVNQGDQIIPVVQEAASSEKAKLALLDRVVPFSNARDSLDYRKMKNATSPLKSKDLFSTYSRESTPLSTENHAIFLPEDNLTKSPSSREVPVQLTSEHTSFSQEDPNTTELLRTDLLNESIHEESLTDLSTSPNTARKIEEINKERVKQSDLIRSMVIGRILRSPEKNRRSSRGSMSPLNASSSSASGSSEHVVKSDCQDTSQDLVPARKQSVLTDSNPEINQTLENSRRSNSVTTGGCQSDGVESADDVSGASSEYSKDASCKNEVAANSKVNQVHHYEPVFTSSPRFRSRPKFDSPFILYASVTNPPTPVNPSTPVFTPVTPDLSTPSSNGDCQQNRKRNKSPSMYRSMPDLSAFLTPSTGEFATPSVKRWEAYKNASTADREKARQAARERARLKSDQELGLEQTDYVLYKDKLRRKISVPEDDVFETAAVVTSGVLAPNSSVKSKVENVRPVSNILDGISSIRPNMDFPLAKSNPFVVSPDSSTPPASSGKRELFKECNLDTKATSGLEVGLETEDFLQPQLRISSKQNPPERKMSPEKAKSIGWDTPPASFPNYFTSVSSQPPSFSSIRSDPVWPAEKYEGGRPRSNTLSDSFVQRNSPAGNSNCTTSTTPSSTALVCTPAMSSKVDSPVKQKPSKSKALSSDMLLDDSPLSTPAGEPYRGASVPDFTRDPSSPERKSKKPKDRERRRSIIQAVSDFFSSRSSNSSGNSPSNSMNCPDFDKPNNGSPLVGKDKFSIFKLTPKLLHKDKRASKSRETLVPGLSTTTLEQTPPAKPPRTGFASYLSQPDMIIQRLSSSPTPFKSSRANVSGRCESTERGFLSKEKSPLYSTPPSNWSNTSGNLLDESLRMKIQDIKMQLEQIENEQRTLETRGVSIEKKLKGEEKDELNRDDVEIMEEWFTLVREKTRLARLERELVVKAQSLELEERQNVVQEQLDRSLNFSDIQKTPDQKAIEVELLNELHSLQQQKGKLISRYQDDIQKYESEDAELEAKIASSSFSPRESNV